MFQFVTYVSRSMAAILEIPQYVAHQKNAVMLLLRGVEWVHGLFLLSLVLGKM